ncbi:low temperature requirement protein A [Chengkuizengella axinellae]|uniref:Low temperature requirement protein A n=1 Tax=Chengkuizengella axinellae TaxID=3064388 RepID=A0ABT9J3W4_9BACL|nr:low temperature requirement protein A [Chengkuizengella sp. 2205SS18-9]MDP5276327.1 low temperature requirement protein A [Chengkuizengella sp. 2205SS18-9]
MHEKRVTWLELFYDLVFVVAIATATHVLLHVEEGVIHAEYLLKFVLMMIPIWGAWAGQTLFINRFGEDLIHQRVFMIIQMFFTLIMISSLSVDFDEYYYSFLFGYLGLRIITVSQYFVARKREEGDRKKVAQYLGTSFWIGLMISALSIFFDSWVRYLIFYLGIFVDIALPIFGRKYLIKHPINIAHLLERFGLFTIILFGESIVSALSILDPKDGDLYSISFSAVSFIVIISMWWQYFDNLEKKVDKTLKTAGQAIIFGHLLIFTSLSMVAVSLQLLYLYEVNYYFMVFFVFVSVVLYFLATTLVFHQYRHVNHRLKIHHLGLFVGILSLFFIIDLILIVPNILIVVQLAIFFIIYAYVTTR